MKRTITTLLGIAALLYTFSSCTCDCNKQNTGTHNDDVLKSPQRTAAASGNEQANPFFIAMRTKAKNLQAIERQVLSMASLPKGIKMSDITIENTRDKGGADDASLLVLNMFNTLMKADGSANALDMQFSMSEKAVEDGLFLFSLRTSDAFKGTQKVTLQLFDEEGFEMVAHNQFQVTAGNNYKALNVKNLPDGFYIIRLSDGENRELLRRIQVGAGSIVN